MTQFNVEQYDQKILNPGIQQLYEHSGFYNVGDWTQQPKSVVAACEALVQRHLVPMESNENTFIIDAGCGLGAGTNQIYQHYKNATITGINISEKQLNHARTKYANTSIQFKQMDAASLDFPENSVNLIVSVEAAFHFNSREKFIKRAYEVLKPGGSLVFTDILFHSTEGVGSWSVPEVNRTIDVKLYNSICTAPGFEIIRQEDITNIAWIGFCNYVGKFPGMKQVAEKLAPSVAHYFITQLKKPA